VNQQYLRLPIGGGGGGGDTTGGANTGFSDSQLGMSWAKSTLFWELCLKFLNLTVI
jgi:hypothetical protein